jgi:hypothetical protein
MRLSLLVALLLTSSAALAAPDLFSRLDRDGDGALSAAELDVALAKRANWIAVDLDRNGRIERPEFRTI